MLTFVRIVLALAALLASWGVSYWLYFARFDVADSPFFVRGAPFLLGVLAAIAVLAATEYLQHGLLSAMVLGALLLAAIGAVLGHFRPRFAGAGGIEDVLLDVIMSAPGGLLLGVPAGAAWWLVLGRRRWARS